MRHQIDTDLIVQALRDHGHSAGRVIPVPDNAGDYEFTVDDKLLSLSEVRILLQEDAERKAQRRSGSRAATSPVAGSAKS